MSARPILEAGALAVGYRRRRRRHPVLTGLSLAVAPGELVCLLGPNGVGKSTLLRTIAGLQQPLAGSVKINGIDIAAIRPADLARLVGVVLSERISVGALRARQMVALGRYAHSNWSGRLDAADYRIVDAAIASVGATHLADRDCRELSDGERQRLNLARVLAQEPKLIVLDEPTAFLDVTARVELMALLRRLTREQALAVVASSHDLDLALRNADVVWIVDAGRRFHIGVPEDLVADGTFAATFAGDRLIFDTDGYGFRAVHAEAPAVSISGTVRGARLAETVAERAGLRVASDAALRIEVTDDSGRWRSSHGGAEISGASYAALAAFLRRAVSPAAIADPHLPQSNRTRG